MARDISLEDCVLDLIDNSLDSYLLKRQIVISELIFGPNGSAKEGDLGRIEVTCNERQIRVVDTCGGISRQRALNEVFCFGHSDDDVRGKLGAYGVGMKRALFKIGNNFHIVSRTPKEGFEVSFKLDEWVSRPDDWKVPIAFIEGASSERKAGTSITITELHDEVGLRIREGGVPKNIHQDAATTYPYFLERCVRLRINDTDVIPAPIKLGELNGVVRAASEKFEDNGVKVEVLPKIQTGR